MTNYATIDGRLARDPDIRFTASGKAVANLRIGHTDRMQNQAGDWVDGETLWDDVTVWGKDAEYVAEHMRQGDLVLVSGRRKARSWEKDGEKRTAVEIVADSVALLRKKGTGSSTAAAASHGYAPATASNDPWANVPDANTPPF